MIPRRARAITGEQLQARCIDRAHLLGFYVAHFRPMQDRYGRWRTPVGADGKGFPDLVIVGPGGQLYRETKGQHESSAPEQRVWAARLVGSSGADFAIWRPGDWDSGLIEAQLQALRLPSRSLGSPVRPRLN